MENEKSGSTPREKFLAFTKKIVAVPKADIDRRERAYQKKKQRRLKGGT